MNGITILLILIIIYIAIYLLLINKTLPYDIVVTGCARDVAIYLDNVKDKLNMIKSLFRSCKIIIYENDSKDDTLDILKRWQNDGFIKLITEKNVKGLRTERIARGRNILYNEAMTYKFDLLIVLDVDNVIEKLSAASIKSCFKIKEDWAMIGANQNGEYYDMWALRTLDDWMPFDCWYCINHTKKDKMYCLDSRLRKIPSDAKPIKVASCFGGFGIYKREYLDNCSYGNGMQTIDNNTMEVCEHVMFNKCIINNGGSLYIVPSLINC
jgi:hypothetical protein